MSNSFKMFEDKNIDELAKQMFEEFEKRTKAFELFHKVTRRIAAYASILSILGFIFLVSKFDFLKSTELYKIGDISVLESWWDSSVCVWLLITFVVTIAFFIIRVFHVYRKMEKPKQKFVEKCRELLRGRFLEVFLCFIYSLPVTALFVFDWGDVLPLFFVFGVLIFISSYSINRKFGYTRAWSRNRTAYQKVQVIYGQYKSGVIFRDEAVKRLYTLYELSIEQAHIDIVKDYEIYGNAALSWVKGLRK